MSRTRFAVTVMATSVAAGAVGCAMGMLFAPASGAEVRRRLAWRARDEYRAMGRSCERVFERAAEQAREELQLGAERVFEKVSKGRAS